MVSPAFSFAGTGVLGGDRLVAGFLLRSCTLLMPLLRRRAAWRVTVAVLTLANASVGDDCRLARLDGEVAS